MTPSSSTTSSPAKGSSNSAEASSSLRGVLPFKGPLALQGLLRFRDTPSSMRVMSRCFGLDVSFCFFKPLPKEDPPSWARDDLRPLPVSFLAKDMAFNESPPIDLLPSKGALEVILDNSYGS